MGVVQRSIEVVERAWAYEEVVLPVLRSLMATQSAASE
jgi:hypothetical protein